jgi:hypothetical protein
MWRGQRLVTKMNGDVRTVRTRHRNRPSNYDLISRSTKVRRLLLLLSFRRRIEASSLSRRLKIVLVIFVSNSPGTLSILWIHRLCCYWPMAI